MSMVHKSSSLSCACAIIQLVASANLWLPDFTRVLWANTLVTPDESLLIIDGGEVWNGTDPNTDRFIQQSTLFIDLEQSFTSQTVQPRALKKDASFPFAKQSSIWYSGVTERLYHLAGNIYGNNDTRGPAFAWSHDMAGGSGSFERRQSHDARTPLWSLPLSSGGVDTGSTWSAPSRDDASQLPESLQSSRALLGSLTASDNTTFWQFGGYSTSDEGSVSSVRSTYLTFNTEEPRWTDGSLASLYLAEGAAVVAPHFGRQGAVILLDGKSSHGQPIEDDVYHTDTTTDFSRIRVYDIASDTVYTQTATTADSSLPEPRLYHCAVGVADAQGNFDIFIFGGIGPQVPPGEAYINDLGTIHVLSLPAFRWYTVPNSQHTPLWSHSCSVIGKRHMIIVGGIAYYGINGTRQFDIDPATNGISMFNLSSLQWMEQHVPNSEPYARDQALSSALNQFSKYPDTWDDPALEDMFVKANDTSAGSSGARETNAGSHTGAIAGGTVGGILALLIVAGLAWWLLRRRRAQYTKPSSHSYANADAHIPKDMQVHEIAGQDRPEMKGSHYYAWEMDGHPKSQRHELA